MLPYVEGSPVGNSSKNRLPAGRTAAIMAKMWRDVNIALVDDDAKEGAPAPKSRPPGGSTSCTRGFVSPETVRPIDRMQER